MRRAGRLTVYSLLLSGSLPVAAVLPANAEEALGELQVIPVKQPVPAELANPPSDTPQRINPARPQTETTPTATPGVEVVRQRYPDGKVRIEREVTLDHNRNYVNQGSWKMFTPAGKLLGQGTYVNGKATGEWVRYYLPGGDDELTGATYEGFKRPFTSTATFVEDRLHGTWTISDDEGRMIVTREFQNDQMHGAATTWRPDGSKRSEMTFHQGLPDGIAVWYPEEDTVVREEQWIRGRRLDPKRQKFHKGKKISEGRILRAQDRKTTSYNWWEGKVERVPLDKPAEDSLHGPWVWWHANGQKKREGTFEAGRAVGPHTEWFVTGQKQTFGEYINGRRTGRWTWWHANGMKRLEGDYLNDQQIGQWTGWNDEGRAVSNVAYNNPVMLTDQGTTIAFDGTFPANGTFPVNGMVPGSVNGEVIVPGSEYIVDPATIPGPVAEQPRRGSGLLMSLPFFRNRR